MWNGKTTGLNTVFHLKQTQISLHLDLYCVLNGVFIWSILILRWLFALIRKLACARASLPTLGSPQTRSRVGATTTFQQHRFKLKEYADKLKAKSHFAQHTETFPSFIRVLPQRQEKTVAVPSSCPAGFMENTQKNSLFSSSVGTKTETHICQQLVTMIKDELELGGHGCFRNLL